MEPPESIDVNTTQVSCDGPGSAGGFAEASGALGHPRVYLKIGHAGWVECPYCDRRFVLADGAGAGAS